MNKTHKHLLQYLEKRPTKKVGHHTYVQRVGNDVTLRLHATDILTARPDGTVVVDAGQWKTPTTKGRLNEHIKDGMSITQDRGVWRWWHRNRRYKDGGTESYWAPKRPLFTNGDIITKTGGLKLVNPSGDKEAAKLLKRIGAFARLCASKLPLPTPGAGDCFYCQMKVASGPNKGQSLGDATNSDHLISHMDEDYVVPSLVWQALCEKGYDPQKQVIHAMAFDPKSKGDGFIKGIVERAVRNFLKKRLGFPANGGCSGGFATR